MKILFCLVAITLLTNPLYAKTINGFNLNNLSIDQSEVFSGGPDRDGIPSIDNPKFITPSEVNYLHPDDMVISFTHGNETKAYPLRILVWHEIVNDEINGKPITVTYCPLCATAMVFDPIIDGEKRTFGVSGLLYRSDVLMYDHQTESLWSQLGMKGVSKNAKDIKLKWLHSEHLTWASWKEKHHDGKVLSTDTGHNRRYASQAYDRYFSSEHVMFPVPKFRTELKDKSKVLGIIIDDVAKAYPLELLKQKNSITDVVNKQPISINYDPISKSIRVLNDSNLAIPTVESYWFAWQGFYPETLLMKE